MSVTLALPNGTGYGEGSISLAKRLSLPSDDPHYLSPEDVTIARQIVESGACMVKINAPDDGCGDGRLDKNAQSSLRAKLFGGGARVATGMLRSLKGLPEDGETLLQDVRDTLDVLAQLKLRCGAHSVVGEACGCGALAKYDLCSRSVDRYSKDIARTLQTLLQNDFPGEAFAKVALQYKRMPGRYFTGLSGGKPLLDCIAASGAQVKQLVGQHHEIVVVLNTVPGTTFDMPLFAKRLQRAGVTRPIQVFAVDLWRGEDYARKMAQYATAYLGMDAQKALGIARAEFYASTLGTAATLTDGSLPVYVVS